MLRGPGSSCQVWWGVRLTTVTPSTMALADWKCHPWRAPWSTKLICIIINNLRYFNAHTLLLAYLGHFFCLHCQSSINSHCWSMVMPPGSADKLFTSLLKSGLAVYHLIAQNTTPCGYSITLSLQYKYILECKQ